MAARWAVVGFRSGDKTAADRRLAEGLEIARALQLPRFEARLVYEQVRLAAMSNEPIDEPLAARVMSQDAQALDGIGDITAGLKQTQKQSTFRQRTATSAQRGLQPSTGSR